MDEDEDLIGLREGLGDALVTVTVWVYENKVPFAGGLSSGKWHERPELIGGRVDAGPPEDFLAKIEARYGRSDRVWIMDRGIPTGETLAAMRDGEAAPVHYLVGTPKGRLTKLEKAFPGQPWQTVRESVEVKLLAEDGELYILAQSRARILKERGMRRRRLKRLWRRLHELRGQSLKRDELLLKLGAAKKDAGRAWHLVSRRTSSSPSSPTACTSP